MAIDVHDDDHPHDDGHGDAHWCTEAYDTAAAAMGIWAATHPSAPGAGVGVAALGTHLAGQVICNGGVEPGPAPSYFDGKLGYDPSQEAPPSFGGGGDSWAPPVPDSFAYADLGNDPDGGFAYVDPGGHADASDHAGWDGDHSGFDYSDNASDSGGASDSSGDPGGM